MSPPPASPSRSTSILIDLLAGLLVPMFVTITNDVNLARIAATATIDDFQASSKADLIAVAQIIAFGLTTVSAVVASMTKDLPLEIMLSLQRNALGFERAANRNRRAMGKYGKGFAAEPEPYTMAEIPASSYAMPEAEPCSNPMPETEPSSYAMPEAEPWPYAMPQTNSADTPAEPEADEISTEPPLFPNEDAARMLEAEAEARLCHPATGPALAPPPDLFPRRTPAPHPGGNPTREPWPSTTQTAADLFKLSGLDDPNRRPQSVREAALSTTAATRLSGPDIPLKR